MKILFITSNFEPNSGWGRLGFEIINRYKKENEVILLTEKKNGDNFSQIKISPGLNFHTIIKNCYVAYKTGKDIDVIHAMDLWPYGLYAFFASRFGYKKYIINGIGTYSVQPLKKFFLGWILKFVYKKSVGIACISNFTKEEIDKPVPGLKTKVVYLGLSKMDSVISNKSILEKYGVTEESFPVLCTVGEIKNRKGQLETAKAVALLKEKYPKIKYLIVGRNYENYVEKIKEVDKCVGGNTIHIVTDANTDAELKAIYERSDVFALNSNNDEFGHYEGFGLVILEANQFGVPAIGSRGCGIEDAIEDGVNGYLCEQGNAEDIKSKIQMILDKKDENMGGDKNYWKQKSIDWANSFSWEKTVKEYLEMYKN